MYERIAQLRGSRAAVFINSFAPSSRAALIFAIPFTIVDAVHYYTAGTALVLSMPLVVLIYLLCGALAGKLALLDNAEFSEFTKAGAAAGLKLWFLSTLTITLIGLIIGASSLGFTLLLSIPYLFLCAPFFSVGGALIGDWVATCSDLSGKDHCR